jgi:hypothetical protein
MTKNDRMLVTALSSTRAHPPAFNRSIRNDPMEKSITLKMLLQTGTKENPANCTAPAQAVYFSL